jgi:hypothetical protein
VFPEHRREVPSRPPAQVSLPVGTMNRQSSSLISKSFSRILINSH